MAPAVLQDALTAFDGVLDIEAAHEDGDFAAFRQNLAD
jgi:hypothetical protein